MRTYRLPLLIPPLIAVLAACGTTPTAPPAPSAPSIPAPGTPAPRITLASEQVRLAELFRGTPVVFSMQQDGALRATVPLRYSFDTGAIKVKPPLAAVLDRLAKSQLQTTARMRVSAPPDPPARTPALARERALSVRDYLMAQGIAPTRLQANGAVQAEQVEIVVSDAAR